MANNREQYLLEQPVDVLQAQAQEYGINTDGTEKHELVRQLLELELPNRDPGLNNVGSWQPDESAPMMSSMQASSDELLARRLQAEEDRFAYLMQSSRTESADTSERRSAGMNLLQFLSQSHRARDEQGNSLPNGSANRLQQLFEVLSRASGSEVGSTTDGTDERGAPRQEQSLARNLALLLSSSSDGANRGNVGQGLQTLVELLSALLPNEGVDAEVVDSRTLTTTFKAQADSDGRSHPDDCNVGDVENVQCMVCLEKFEDGENIRILPCVHRYHRDCVDRWLAENRRCPVCKHDITQ